MNRKSYGLTVLLTLLLGGIGAHHFYLEKPGIGIIYLLFCWTFIPAFISLLEVIAFVTQGKGAFDKKYNAN